MKILCAYSSIPFSCDYFPAELSSREVAHPIFHIPQRKLLGYVSKWSAGQLTPTDSYLLFLAVLRNTDLVDFRVPAIRTELTDSIIANNMESLMRVTTRLDAVVEKSAYFPHYVISQDTKSLDNVHYWIVNWADAYEEYRSGKSRDHDLKRAVQKQEASERALERLIKNPHRPIASYSSQIADWASTACNFPSFNIRSPFTGLPITCSDYWKIVINKCANEDSVFSIRRKDIEELLEHCEDHMSNLGTIYSSALFKILRSALEKQKNFLGLGDMDIGTYRRTGTYSILDINDSAEQANIQAMIKSAPESAPDQKSYPTKLAYLKAKMRYEMSLKYAESPSEVESNLVQSRRGNDQIGVNDV
jgi:hypothetical protein